MICTNQGDVLISLNGNLCTTYLKLEETMDDSIGIEIQMQIQRGGISMDLKMIVQVIINFT
jgi:hypothetical protein